MGILQAPDAFVDDLLAAWSVHGAAAVERFAKEHPREFLLLVAMFAFEELRTGGQHDGLKKKR
jgi:hypothetical protein